MELLFFLSGSYDQLLHNNSLFTEMMAAFQDTKDDIHMHSSTSSPASCSTPPPNAGTELDVRVADTDTSDGCGGGASADAVALASAEITAPFTTTTAATTAASSTTSIIAGGKSDKVSQNAGTLIVTEEREVTKNHFMSACATDMCLYSITSLHKIT